MNQISNRVPILKLKERNTLDEAAYIVIHSWGGMWDDVVKLLIEAVELGKMQAIIHSQVNQFNGFVIQPIDPSQTTIKTSDLIAWLANETEKKMGVKRTSMEESIAEHVKAIGESNVNKTPAKLYGKGHSEAMREKTTLTKYLELDTWTPIEAAMLVCGLQPEPNCQQVDIPQYDYIRGLDDTHKLWNDRMFDDANHVLRLWNSQENPPSKVKPADYVKWCKTKGIDTGWLRDIEPSLQQPAQKFVSPMLSTLSGWFDKTLADLPKKQREFVDRSNLYLKWDDYTPAEREIWCAEWNYNHNPTTKDERETQFNLYAKQGDIEREIRELELLPVNKPSEHESKKKQLKELNSKLDAIQSKMDGLRDIEPAEPQTHDHDLRNLIDQCFPNDSDKLAIEGEIKTVKFNNGGKMIDFKHWFGLPFWTPQEAIFLLNLYDPSTTPLQPETNAEINKRIMRAEREQKADILPANVSPAEWIEWNDKKGFIQYVLIERMAKLITTNPQPEAAQEGKAPIQAKLDFDADLAALFDPVGIPQLEKMFPCSKWASFGKKAKEKGLVVARIGRGKYNPYLAAHWWLGKQEPQGWDIARVNRVLANNLPARSRDSKTSLTGEF